MSDFSIVGSEDKQMALGLKPGTYLEYTESQLAQVAGVVLKLIVAFLLLDGSIRREGWSGNLMMVCGVAGLMFAAFGIYRCSNPRKHRLVVTPERLSWGEIGMAGADSLKLDQIAGVILNPHDSEGVRVVLMNGNERRIEWDFFRNQERPDFFFLSNGIELIGPAEQVD